MKLFSKNSVKGSLHKELISAKNAHIKEEFNQSKHKIETFSRLGNFEDSKILIDNLSSKLEENQLNELIKLKRNEELKFLISEFKKHLKLDNTSKLEMSLSEIQTRTSNKDYLK